MTLIPLQSNKSVLLHFLFWVVVWFFYVYFFSYNSTNLNYVVWFSSFLLIITMSITYFFVYYLIAQYLLKRQYGSFVLYSFYTLVISTYLIVLTILGSFIFLSKLELETMPPMSRNYIFILILVYLVVLVISFVSLFNHNIKTSSRNRELENKILETQLHSKEQELKYLRQQIHPHFLFNTLNTIYGFALKKSESTPELILKLSNLLDYILYETGKPAVSLDQEMEHLKEYIELEKFRFQDTLKISFTNSSPHSNLQIAPMLFIPFVENAFKHGSIVNGFLDIEIALELQADSLHFHIKNTIKPNHSPRTKSGIGLQNIRKRLDLHYSNQYELKIEDNQNWFSVNLTLHKINPASK